MDNFGHYTVVKESVPDIKVSEVANCSEITDVFRYRLWAADEGLDYLAGIFQFVESNTATDVLIALDGKAYSVANNENAINAICKRVDRLKKFWDHSSKKDRYSPSFFIKWGLQHREIFDITWLNDAVEKNLVDKKLLSGGVNSDQAGQDLREVERVSMLKIIAGMSAGSYGYPSQGAIKKITMDMQELGVHVAENTLSKYLKSAKSFLPISLQKK